MKLTIYENYHAGVAALPEEEQDAFYGAIARYVFEGVEPELQGVSAAVWATIKPLVEKSVGGQINGAKGGNGRGNKKEDAKKQDAKTSEENPLANKDKTTIENHHEKPPRKTPSENQKKRKEEKGRERENPKDFSFSPSVADDTAAARAAPSAPKCPKCGSGTIGTNSSRCGKKLYVCPDCFEEVYA